MRLCLEGWREVGRWFTMGRLRFDLGEEGGVRRGLECCWGEVRDKATALPCPAYATPTPSRVGAALGPPRRKGVLGMKVIARLSYDPRLMKQVAY